MLKNKNLPSLVRYCLVGGLSYGLEITVLISLHSGLGLQRTTATAISFWIGLVVAFFLQKLFAFKDYKNELRVIGHQVFYYSLLVIFNYIFTLTIVSLFPDRFLLASRTLALLLTTFWNFFVYKHIIFTQRNHRFLPRFGWLKSLVTRRGLINGSVVLMLIICTAYGAWQSSYASANSSDALVDTYLVGDGWHSSHINLQPEHTNLVKLPIFWLQSLLPYHFASFLVVNIILAIAAVLGWLLLSMKIFGSRYIAISALALCALTFSSPLFNSQFAWSTVRNIEFPLALAYVMWLISFSNRKLPLCSGDYWNLTLVTALYSLLMASDLYFLYVVDVPLIVFLLIKFITSKGFRQSLLAFASIAVSAIVSKLILWGLQAAGLIHLYSSGQLTRPVQHSLLIQSMKEAFRQFRELSGANFFHQSFSFSMIAAFINFLIIACGTLAAVYIIGRALYGVFDKKSQNPAIKAPVITASVLIFFVAFFAYSLSSQVLQRTASGAIQVIGQGRYITIMVLLVVLLLVYAIQQFVPARYYGAICCLLLLSIVVTGFRIGTEYREINKAASAQTGLYKKVGEVLAQNGVREVLTGHWYGASLRFWSDDKLHYAPVTGCDHPFRVLSRTSWYTASRYSRTALLVDHQGYDAPFWNGCTDQFISSIYGPPAKKLTFGDSLTAWIYNYDVRSKLILTAKAKG